MENETKRTRHPKPEGWEPEPRFPDDWQTERKQGTPRCMAWNPNQGRQCAKSPIRDKSGQGRHPAGREYRTTCRSHNGNAPRGIAHHSYEGKSRGRYIPMGYEEAYERAKRGQDTTDLSHELALLRSRLEYLLKQVDTGAPGRLWREARESFNGMIRATSDAEAERHANELQGFFSRGISDAETWDEIGEVIDRTRQLANAQDRIEDRKRRTVSAETWQFQYQTLGRAVVENIESLVEDEDLKRELRQAIGQDFIAQVGIPALPDDPASAGD